MKLYFLMFLAYVAGLVSLALISDRRRYTFTDQGEFDAGFNLAAGELLRGTNRTIIVSLARGNGPYRAGMRYALEQEEEQQHVYL